MLFGILLTNVLAQSPPGAALPPCNPEDIKAGLSLPIIPTHVNEAIHKECPALDGEEHSTEQDCECARTVRENADMLTWIPSMHCQIDGIDLIVGWTTQTLKQPECQAIDFCDTEKISEALQNTHVGEDAHNACPALRGEEHTEVDDCDCARVVVDNADFLRSVPSMDCEIPLEEDDSIALWDWAYKTLAECAVEPQPGNECDPDAISHALHNTHLGTFAHDACPVLEGKDHSKEQDCICARSLTDNVDFMRTLPELNCEVGEGKFLIDWAFEQAESCEWTGPVCNPEKIGEELMFTHLGQLAKNACPILTGEKHDEQQDCNCARSLTANEDFLMHIGAMHCKMPMDDGNLVSIFDWAKLTMGACGEEIPVCNPNRITEDIEGSWADGAAQDFCPILAGRPHSDEDDCRCAQALRDHGDGLQEFTAMNCLMPVEGGNLKNLLHDWPEFILAKCYEGMCSEEAVYEGTKDLELFKQLADGCPNINRDDPHRGEEENDDCKCAATLRELDAELRNVEALDCWIPTEHGGRMTLLDGWVPEQLHKCNQQCDLADLKNKLDAFTFGSEIVAACPALREEEHTNENDCKCAKTVQQFEDQLRENGQFDCFLDSEGELVSLLDEWVPRVVDERCPEEAYMCNPEEIAGATRDYHFYGEIERACPVLRGDEHTEADDCKCAEAVRDNGKTLEGIPQWNCHLEIDGRMLHLIHNWTWETLDKKCGPAIPENACEPTKIAEDIRHFPFYFELEMACPALRGEDHTPENDCECSKMVDDHRYELEMIPSMHCFLEVDGKDDMHHSISLLDEWVPRAMMACEKCRDDPEGFVAADPHKDCSMVHTWWSCDTYDNDFNGVARWVWELCPMSCGKCHDEPTHYHPEPEHDPSKCTEWGSFDEDCCAEHEATTCSDGFMPILSEVTCDPNNHAWVTFYSCVPNRGGPAPTSEMWEPAPGHDATKCREHGHYDDDCCAENHGTSCSDGYRPILSGSTCDPHNPSPFGVFRYSCVPGAEDSSEEDEPWTREFAPAAGHDSSKCREWGEFDNDCCAEHKATSCADGYQPVMSDSRCWSTPVFHYSCVPPHLPAPEPAIAGEEAKDVFRGLMETTERMADALHLGHDLETWKRFAWNRRRSLKAPKRRPLSG